MIISWVDIKTKIETDFPCCVCKEKIEGKNAKQITIQLKGFGRGDDEILFTHKDCGKQIDGENHIKYAQRLLDFDNLTIKTN